MAAIVYTAAAEKGLKRLQRAEPKAASTLIEKIKTFAANPTGQHSWAKSLTGQPGTRIRQGDYRAVIIVMQGEPKVLRVVKVAKRGDVYDD